MITKQLINPKNIAIIGGSEEIIKPGGAIVNNIKNSQYGGELYIVNPKLDIVQGIKSYRSVEELPQVDCAILAISAKFCLHSVEVLCLQKSCKAIIIVSAGFHEDSEEGAEIERAITTLCNNNEVSLIGPNCIGIITPYYPGVFTKPIPTLTPKGVDIISGSGATLVFILEYAMLLGLPFSHLFSVGNSAQLGVEDILEYLDETYIDGESAPVKLLYIESISNPQKLLTHAKSLIRKGAKIAAIKSGYSEAGSRAASSHTGALASPDQAVTALFKKAGIIRAFSRVELINLGAAMMQPEPKGNRVAIVTHAGGPAVMLTDILSSNGINIPKIEGPKAEELLTKLYAGSSVSNPIDFLATGTAQQLSDVLEACENDFDVDAIPIIFGSPGLADNFDAYEVIFQKLQNTKKPLYPILPSVINTAEEIALFQNKGGISFLDEVALGSALAKIINNKKYKDSKPFEVDRKTIRKVIDNASNGYLEPNDVQTLLDAAGIPRAKEMVVEKIENAIKAAKEIGYPIVMKVVGPVHKSDVGGVTLNITNNQTIETEFNRMMKIKDATGVLLQPMLSGRQIYIGAKREDNFGHLVLCGLGGIFVEALKDVQSSLTPISEDEASEMIHSLRAIEIIKGTRGEEGVSIPLFNEMIRRVSALCEEAKEIFEMDINPLLGTPNKLTAVDARIRIEKEN